MNINLDWSRPIPIRKVRGALLEYAIDLDQVPTTPGIYVFGRQWGKGFEALYVGQAARLRGRVRSHLNNRKLLAHLAEARTGKRVLLVAELWTGRGQSWKKCLTLAERAFIRHFLAEGHDLVNKQGTRIRRHIVSSTGQHPKRWFPREVALEKRRGE